MKNRGFTLIELMIVIAFVGVIASVIAGYFDKRRVSRDSTPPSVAAPAPATPVSATPPPSKP